jgi:hypothetical protein
MISLNGTDTRLQFPVLTLFDLSAWTTVGLDPAAIGPDGEIRRFWAYYTESDKMTSRGNPYGDIQYLEPVNQPAASTRGQTAHLLLVIDEAQDQVASHIEAVFTPMRAARNAIALYIGTVKTTHDFLWQKELEREQVRDGIQRVYMIQPDTVCHQNPDYRRFLDAQVRRYGRHHPIVASE